MLKREVVNYKTGTKYSVSFFDDDTVETVRQKIAISADTHPDRLFILVGLKLDPNYYQTDPRRWEALFERLSYTKQTFQNTTYQEYQTKYRIPQSEIPFEEQVKEEWMVNENENISPFTEFRIFGVPEKNSFILPREPNELPSVIPSARLPIPENNTLISTLYNPENIVRFEFREFEKDDEPFMLPYYPLLRSNTPDYLSQESVNLILKNSNILNELLSIKTPEPSKITILRSRFYTPLVETNFGFAVRTLFEQIFYGLTVSKKIPYCVLFNSREQTSLHKFYTEDPKTKNTFIDKSLSKTWWALTKPARNRPTLIFYRGDSKNDFDRIAITSTDIVISTYRPEGNTQSLDKLKAECLSWLETFDSLIPFVTQADISNERWQLQDMSFVAKYREKFDEFDLLRFDCISNIFGIVDKNKSQFNLLRTDHSYEDITATEVKIIQMLKDDIYLSADRIRDEFSIPLETARQLLSSVSRKIEETPNLGDRLFRGYPTLLVGSDFVEMTSTNNIEKSIQYSNLLRYILSNPESDEVLDKVCPKRMERVGTVIHTEDIKVDESLAKEFGDLFAYAEDEEVEEPIEEEEEVSIKISTKQKQATTYNYFKNRLQEFDPETFQAKDSKYPKKCEQKHQPIILSESDLKRLENTPYNINSYMSENRKLEVENPDGTTICPEYWCVKDVIPLREDQLIMKDGVRVCPICKLGIQTKTNTDLTKYPVIQRENGFLYPGFVNYKSPANDKFMPCCFKKPRSKELTTKKEIDDIYYILGETKTDLKSLRLSFIKSTILESLNIKNNYSVIGTRLQNGMSGFFRIGVGNVLETLPFILDLKTTIPLPRDSIKTILQCSFLKTWKTTGDQHLEKIREEISDNEKLVHLISGVDFAFENNELKPIEYLEYCCLFLQCDVFKINSLKNAVSCMFRTPLGVPRKRAIIVLQQEDQVNIVCHVTRKSNKLLYNANVYSTFFEKETYVELEILRNKACKTSIPTYNDALNVIRDILVATESDDFSLLLDPFQLAQAFYVPAKIYLPFKSSPIPEIVQPKISEYTELPFYEKVLDYLKIAEKSHVGYTFSQNIYDNFGNVVEIETESGLRIPISPKRMKIKSETTEVMKTVNDIGEQELVFGNPSEKIISEKEKISYNAEVFEFLIFQLTNDLETEYKELRSELQQININLKRVDELLQKWFNETVTFIDISKPTTFLSKIRNTCNKDSCDGNLCGIENGVCKITIQNKVNKEKLYHKLISTLVENQKIRAMILDGRTTPFFSTILYIQLPHEVILSDNQLD